MSFVLIDSGHNRLTAGKRSPDNTLFEYEFNFDVSCRIREELVRHGVKAEVQQVVLENSTDEILHRVQLANRLKPDFLVSVHANAFGSDFNDANGWEIYCYRMQGDGYRLSQAIEKESIPYLGLRNRGIKDGSGLAMVGKTTMPAVLIEHGFYTNRRECELMKTDAFRSKCAMADAKGILSYLGIEWKYPSEEKKQTAVYRDMVQKRFSFADGTMEYLDNYQYADALYQRLAETQ